MGRLTRGSKRTRIQEYMKKMRDQFRAALKDDDLQTALDELWPTWSNEMAEKLGASEGVVFYHRKRRGLEPAHAKAEMRASATHASCAQI